MTDKSLVVVLPPGVALVSSIRDASGPHGIAHLAGVAAAHGSTRTFPLNV